MNYWERHIGDYARDTAHLSMLEHGAYTLLLDRYYATEKPIPADQVHRLTRARTPAEKAAIDAVLQEFFTLEDGCWRQSRCDELIQEYQDGEPAREAKRQNATERQRRARERREAMFKELAGHGIHPDWNATSAELKTLLDGVTSQPVTLPVTCDITATHTQTHTQTPKLSVVTDTPPAKPSASLRAADLMNLGVPEQVATDFLAIRKAKRAPLTRTALDGIVTEADKAGVSLAQALAECAEAGWQSFKAQWHVNRTGKTEAPAPTPPASTYRAWRPQ